MPRSIAGRADEAARRRRQACVAAILTVFAIVVPSRALTAPRPHSFAWPARSRTEAASAQLAWLQIMVNEAARLRLLAGEAERVAEVFARGDDAAVAGFHARLEPRDEALVRAWIEPWLAASIRQSLRPHQSLAAAGPRAAGWAGGFPSRWQPLSARR